MSGGKGFGLRFAAGGAGEELLALFGAIGLNGYRALVPDMCVGGGAMGNASGTSV